MDKDFVKRFLKGSASTSFGTLVSVGFHFLSVTLLARYTTKEVLGLYFLILAIANGGKILANLGLDLTLVHFLVSEESDVQQQTFAVIVWIRLIIFALLTLLIYFFGGALLSLFDANLLTYQWYLPVLLALMSFRELFFYILQGLQKFRRYAMIQSASAVLKFVLVLLLRDSLDLTTLLWIEFAMLGASLLLQSQVIPFKALAPPRMMFHREVLPRIFRFGLPLYANSALTYVSNFGAVFIIGLYLTPVAIAAYGIAWKIPEGFTRLFASFRVVYFPGLSSLISKGDIKSAQKLMNQSLTLLGAGTFGLVLGALLFRREIILLVFEEKYLDVQPAFVLFMLAVCLQLLGSIMGYSLVSAGRPERSTIVNVIAMGLEFTISLLLIPRVGYMGAVYSFIIMTIISQILCYLFLREAGLHIDLQVYLLPFLFLGVTSGIYLLAGTESLILKVLLLLGYAGLCLFFIPICRQMISYAWRTVKALNFEAKPV